VRLRRLDTPDKTGLYRRAIAMQTAVIASMPALSWVGGVSAASLGLLAPRSWWISASLGGGFISYFMYVGLRQRQKAQKLRERMRGRGGDLLLPDTMRELSWYQFAGIEVGRAYGEVEGYQPRPFGCEVGSQFHQRHGSRSPPYNAVRPDFPGTV
jgi:hypothetical protein